MKRYSVRKMGWREALLAAGVGDPGKIFFRKNLLHLGEQTVAVLEKVDGVGYVVRHNSADPWARARASSREEALSFYYAGVSLVTEDMVVPTELTTGTFVVP